MAAKADLTHIAVAVSPMDYSTEQRKYACPSCTAGLPSPPGSHVAFQFSAPALDTAVRERGWTGELWGAELRVRLVLYQVIHELSAYPPPLSVCDLWVEGPTSDDSPVNTSSAVLTVPRGERGAWAAAIGQAMTQACWSPPQLGP